MRVATGEVDWWPEAFPCRAAFAAVGLATREYISGKHGALCLNACCIRWCLAVLRISIKPTSAQGSPKQQMAFKRYHPYGSNPAVRNERCAVCELTSPAKNKDGFVVGEKVWEDACHGPYLIVFGHASVLKGLCVKVGGGCFGCWGGVGGEGWGREGGNVGYSHCPCCSPCCNVVMRPVNMPIRPTIHVPSDDQCDVGSVVTGVKSRVRLPETCPLSVVYALRS
ncbi:hypothetical protein HaLaN_14433 [Haematococcus lacustris]|uniref:Uncharacterized protein n=1 Tax=Haematococcus lacustris TaxID=44745 RepID=A0A699ZEG4_HAELA|nr:hypothetical protein HaLaN_14433 [Haematococcus lacustris]